MARISGFSEHAKRGDPLPVGGVRVYEDTEGNRLRDETIRSLAHDLAMLHIGDGDEVWDMAQRLLKLLE